MENETKQCRSWCGTPRSGAEEASWCRTVHPRFGCYGPVTVHLCSVACMDAGRPRRFVVKVQLSLHTNMPQRQMLVYDHDSRLTFQGDATKDVKRLMGERPKAFFWATINRSRQLELHEEAPWQTW